MQAPKVPNAAAIKRKYGGQKITFVGDSVGNGHVRDTALAKQFTKNTGIKVKVVPHPAASDQSYAQLARAFSSKSSSIDVAMIDVVWPGAFAPYLVNLKPKLGKQSKLHLASIVANDTIKGRLVAMPWFGDYGILYYRTDLLKKYGYSGPPKTWTTLFQMAKKIQDGERGSNPNFSGFVFQGNAYEGLTCNALEWIASAGGGHIIDNGKVTIDNAKARTVLNTIAAQIGKTAPQGVTTYQEDQTEHAFDNGDAAFARNWPYQYGIGAGAGSKVKGKFSVTVLPHGASGKSVGTVGGWQLAVSKFSKHQGASIELVRYMTSPAVEKFDAITNSNVPTIVSVAKNKAVVKANPYLKPAIASVARVTRPAKFLGPNYNEASKVVYQGINQILTGSSASQVLPQIKSRLRADPEVEVGNTTEGTREDGACHPPSPLMSSVATPAPVPRRRRRRHTKLQRRQTRLAWLLLLPALAVVVFVAIYPLARTVYQSFTNQEFLAGLEPTKRVGLDNYRTLIHDTIFRDTVVLTIKFTVITVSLEFLLGLIIALVVNSHFKGRGDHAGHHARALGDPDGRRREDVAVDARRHERRRQRPRYAHAHPLAPARVDRRPFDPARRGLRGRHLEDDAVRRATAAGRHAGDPERSLRSGVGRRGEPAAAVLADHHAAAAAGDPRGADLPHP